MPEAIKIPVDFGAAHGRFVCRRHGDQEGGLAIRIDTRSDRPAINRVFCGQCLVEALESMTIPMRSKD